MLTNKTVFVLGAGASAPFDYPTGVELSAELIRQLLPGNDTHTNLQEWGKFSLHEIDAFRNTFYYSGKNSIDAFLEHRPEYLRIGKAAITDVLIRYEKADAIFRYKQNWLRYTYEKLNTSFDEFGENRLVIITFNYDRVVEHFFHTALKHSYGKTDDECAAMLAKIPIIHLHGVLSQLPWQSPSGYAYGSGHNEARMAAGIKNIKVIHEDIRDGRDAEFQAAKNAFLEAKRIYFLGFGYGRVNIDRLGIIDIEKGKAVGTGFGLLGGEIQAIVRTCNNRILISPNDCLTVLRDQVNWD